MSMLYIIICTIIFENQTKNKHKYLQIIKKRVSLHRN